MDKDVLIYGAGAIGRGFIAPLLQKYDYKINFVDKDHQLISELKKKKTLQSGNCRARRIRVC